MKPPFMATDIRYSVLGVAVAVSTGSGNMNGKPKPQFGPNVFCIPRM